MHPAASLIVRGCAGALGLIVILLGLALQQHRALPGADELGTVAYVLAAGMGLLTIAPRLRAVLLAAVVGTVAVAIEFFQLSGIPADLAGRSRFLRLLLGQYFSWVDVVWLIVGAVILWALVRVLQWRTATRLRWPVALALVGSASLALVASGALSSGVPAAVRWAPVALCGAWFFVAVLDFAQSLSRDDRVRDLLALRASIAATVAILSGAGLHQWWQRVEFSLPQQAFGAAAAWAIGLAAMLAVIAGWRAGVPQRWRTLSAIAIAGVTVALAIVPPIPPRSAPARPPVPQTTVAPPPVVAPPEVLPPAPAPTAPPELQLCRAVDLTARTQGWDAAMGDTAVTIVVTHHGRTACALDGLASMGMLQGRTPVDLSVAHESLTQPGRSEAARRVRLEPGHVSSVTLWWKGYRNQADQSTPQAVTLLIPGVGSVPVELTDGPAPFDVIDGAVINISAWR